MNDTPDPQRRPVSDITGAVANLEEALAMLRSAGEIAARDGAETNWPAFRESVAAALRRFGLRPVSPRTYRLTPGANATSAGVDEGMRERDALIWSVAAAVQKWLPHLDMADQNEVAEDAIAAILATHEIVKRES